MHSSGLSAQRNGWRPERHPNSACSPIYGVKPLGRFELTMRIEARESRDRNRGIGLASLSGTFLIPNCMLFDQLHHPAKIERLREHFHHVTKLL